MEERYAGHSDRIDEIAAQVAELRRNVDEMGKEIRMRRWEASMDRHEEENARERADRDRLLLRMLRAIKERTPSE